MKKVIWWGDALRLSVMVLLALVLLPGSVLAQSGIAGVVRDESGGVLPGVTVEASSPALIEKTRSAVTDDQGQYRILDLRPGQYSVTFMLSGFASVRREGISLESNFTATLNAEMPIGALEETLVVTGGAPVVDVQNVSARHVIQSDVIDTLPTAKSIQNLAVTIPGMGVTGGMRIVAQDVGGMAGDRTFMTIHGSRDIDQTMQMDGMTFNTMQSSGASPGYTPNPGEVAEYAYEVGNLNAETQKGGVRVNMIPREGGNALRWSLFLNGANEDFVGNNITQELRDRGLGTGNYTKNASDLTFTIGGPVKQNKLWWQFSFRRWGFTDYVADMWWDSDPLDYVFTPDLGRPATNENITTSTGVRLTWQANRKNKVSFHFIDQTRCLCQQNVAATRAPEASVAQLSPVLYIMTASWSAPITNKLLFEAGWIRNKHHFGTLADVRDDVGPADNTLFGAQDRDTGIFFRSRGRTSFTENMTDSFKVVMSYVTGSHAFKTGSLWRQGYRRQPSRVDGPIPALLRFRSGVADSIIVYTDPYTNSQYLNYDGGLFVQDQWTRKRLTLYGGLRWDHLNAQAEPVNEPAAYWVGPRSFPGVKNVPNWNDVSPRMGGSFDLFGDGKTAIKFSRNRYVEAQALDYASAANGLTSSVNNTTRTWVDRDGDFYPDLDELGPLANSNFGKQVISTTYDPDLLEGWGKRPYNWETSFGVQHELMPQVAFQANYHRRAFGNFTVTDNRAVTPDDYSPYSITAPAHPALPNGGGYPITGLYDINPNKFGASDNFVTLEKNLGGDRSEVYNGVDVSVNARLSRRIFLQGGTSTGRVTEKNCTVIDSPQALYNCEVTPPFLTQLKLSGSIELPYAIQLAATYQDIPGPEYTAPFTVRNVDVQGLGRPLSGGANASATVDLVNRGELYENRLHQLDVRVARWFDIGRLRMKASVDIFNATNSNPILALNNTFGPAWRSPVYVLPPRMLKFNVQVDY